MVVCYSYSCYSCFLKVSVSLYLYITIYISSIYKELKKDCTSHFLTVTTVTVTSGLDYLSTKPFSA